MSVQLSDLWKPQGTTGRLAYLGWGTGLMALKYNLDRVLAGVFRVGSWTWMSYWQPWPGPISTIPEHRRLFLFVLLACALPFIAGGIVLTVRRLRDAQWPLWLACLFFLPVVNLVFFLCVSLAPSRLTPPVLAATGRSGRWLAFSNPVASAFAGLGLTLLLTIPVIAFGTAYLRSYGWGLFVGIPFFMGLISALIHSAGQPRSWGSCAGVAMLSVLFAGLAMVFLALEGVICVLMAAPLALPLAILGATVAYGIQSTQRSYRGTETLYGAAWLALPVLLFGEAQTAPVEPVIEATTSIVISASPETVWRDVVAFSELPAPRDLIFRSGIAYPVRARIWGHGIGAIRHCEFSTGPFVEPITVWDENRRLAFNVTQQPAPMQELSPYADIHPPHLDGFFNSRHGQFLLTALPGGRTRLDGTTWYQQKLWPNVYWRMWSNYLVHRIHTRVLEHIKAEAEASLRT